MSDETLAALKASIKHWDDNVMAKTPGGASVGANACALCGLYIERRCFGCPVAGSGHDDATAEGPMGTPARGTGEGEERWMK